MEELSHLLLVSRGALLCLVEKEKSLLLSQLATEELSQFSNLKYKRSIASTKDSGGEGPRPDLVERTAHGS